MPSLLSSSSFATINDLVTRRTLTSRGSPSHAYGYSPAHWHHWLTLLSPAYIKLSLPDDLLLLPSQSPGAGRPSLLLSSSEPSGAQALIKKRRKNTAVSSVTVTAIGYFYWSITCDLKLMTIINLTLLFTDINIADIIFAEIIIRAKSSSVKVMSVIIVSNKVSHYVVQKNN